MKTIKEIIASLSKTDKDMLRAAFQSETHNQYVEYEPGRFVGVFINHEHLSIEQRCGFWAEGLLTGHTIPFPTVSIAYQPFAEVEHA